MCEKQGTGIRGIRAGLEWGDIYWVGLLLGVFGVRWIASKSCLWRMNSLRMDWEEVVRAGSFRRGMSGCMCLLLRLAFAFSTPLMYGSELDPDGAGEFCVQATDNSLQP